MNIAQIKLDNGITRVIHSYPFFAPGILKLQPMESNEVKTIGTDGVKLVYNPGYIMERTPEEIGYLILHEWYHVMLLHHTRRGERDHSKWNRAGDYEINNLLKDLPRVTMPKGVLYDPKFDGMTIEAIYDRLEDDPESESREKSKGQSAMGEVFDHPGDGNGLTEEQRQEAEQDVRNSVFAGIGMAKEQGDLPNHLKRVIDDLFEPKINWRAELAAFVQFTAKDDYTYRKPNLRLSHTGFMFPSLHSENIPALVFVGDTSGSISQKEIKEYSADLVSAFDSVPISGLYAIWCDSNIESVQVFERGDDIKLEPAGGGGTDFRPPFNYVEQEGIDTAALIYLTDGYCSRFAPEPDYPVLWCIYGGNKGFTPPYGRVIHVDFESN